MIGGEGARQFDLYDFFSIFIPGAALLFGLVPFFPKSIGLPTTATIGIVIVGGFVLGRMVHAFRLLVESTLTPPTSHREELLNEIQNPTDVSEDLVDDFYSVCQDEYEDLNLADDRNDLSEEELDALYSVVRSVIHIDSRGRSRTFQAVLDFYGSIWISSAALGVLYALYALVQLTEATVFGETYQTYLSTVQLPPELIFGLAISVAMGTYVLAKMARRKYRTIFVQYLMADFLVLHEQSD